jgi:BirA family biotin operon repressor/biotin-[acetyl-CoA-carboxylase] ligase
MTLSNPSSVPIWPIGWTVHHVAETGSTNDDLVAAGKDGAADQTVVVADYQTAGKGRLDRVWEATCGTNLLVSMLFRYGDAEPSRFPRVVALSARATCERRARAHVALKWPNDLVVDDRKLAGILSVAVPQNGFVVVGIGVNVGWAPPEAVALLDVCASSKVDAEPTESALGITPLSLLADMLLGIDERRILSDDELHREHRSQLSTLGRRVRVEMRAGQVLVGMAEDLDVQSRLIVRADDGRHHVIDVGDVVHLRSE